VPSLQWYSPGDEDDLEGCSSSVELAVLFRRSKLFKVVTPDPALDDFERLWSYVGDSEAADVLARSQLPASWSKIIVRLITLTTYDFGDYASARECIARIGDAYGGRLTELEPRGCADLLVVPGHQETEGSGRSPIGAPPRCRDLGRTLPTHGRTGR